MERNCSVWLSRLNGENSKMIRIDAKASQLIGLARMKGLRLTPLKRDVLVHGDKKWKNHSLMKKMKENILAILEILRWEEIFKN